MLKNAILAGNIGIVAVASMSNPDESGKGNYDISLLASEQLEILAKFAAGSASSNGTGKYSDVTTKRFAIELASGRIINIMSAAFVK